MRAHDRQPPSGGPTARWDEGSLEEARAEHPTHLLVAHSPDLRRVGSLEDASAEQTWVGRDLGDRGLDVGDADTRASRRHCLIERRPEGLTVTDGKSTNGTFLNGRRLRPHVAAFLHDGDFVRAGDTLLVAAYGLSPDLPFRDPMLPGRSAAVREAREWLQRVADLAYPLLILGETGTGKEYVARGIHRASARRDRPFVAVNCGELDRSIGRAELFGYVKGAFSGATETKEGLVAAAGEGTLFLDEVGELDQPVQKELLRFLQDGTFRKVGGVRVERGGARILAATNVDLSEAVSAGDFRADLLARLCPVEPATLPPLRERPADLLLWARLLADEVARELGLAEPLRFDAWVAEALLLWPFPANLRELRSVIMTASLKWRPPAPAGLELLPDAMAKALRDRRAETEEAEPEASATEPPKSLLRDKDRGDWERLTAALVRHEGNVSRAAEELGHSRKWAHDRINALGIDLPRIRAGGPP